MKATDKVEAALKKVRGFLYINDMDVRLVSIDEDNIVKIAFDVYGWCSWRALDRLSKQTIETILADVEEVSKVEIVN